MITNNELFRNTNEMYDRNVIEIHCHNMRVNVSYSFMVYLYNYMSYNYGIISSAIGKTLN